MDSSDRDEEFLAQVAIGRQRSAPFSIYYKIEVVRDFGGALAEDFSKQTLDAISNDSAAYLTRNG